MHVAREQLDLGRAQGRVQRQRLEVRVAEADQLFSSRLLRSLDNTTVTTIVVVIITIAGTHQHVHEERIALHARLRVVDAEQARGGGDRQAAVDEHRGPVVARRPVLGVQVRQVEVRAHPRRF